MVNFKQIIGVSACATFLASVPASAFVVHHPGSTTTSKRVFATSKNYPTSSRLYSSFDDDELSKLIGKRNQIKRKKREELPKEEDVLEEIVEKVDPDAMDLDKMPEFQTKRVKRERKKDKEEEEDTSRAASQPAEVVDYTADYDDENDFHIPNRIGISTRCWGEAKEGFVSGGKLKKADLRAGKFVPGDLQMAYNKLIEEGIVLIETSPEYGKAMTDRKLSAEHILGRCIKEQESEISPLIVTTFPNTFYQRSASGVTNSAAESCERMEISGVELLQVKSTGWLPTLGLIQGMTDAVVETASANFVGVQNVSPVRLRRIQSKLDNEGIVLTSNSFEFSLTKRKNEKWIQYCKTLGVIPLIQNPLDGGLASAQFTASNPSGGIAGANAKYSFKQLEKLQPLHSVLESVAARVQTRVKREVKDVNERNRGRYGPMVSW
jgi:aryl-alcohol dehydrogenase-like predicted oxidoreductase